MAATAQAQAEATKAAQRAGIEASRGDRSKFDLVVSMLAMGENPSQIGKATGLSRQAVLRIRDHRDMAEAALLRWSLRQ